MPFDAIRSSGIPMMVVSGGHSAAYDAVCDVLVRELAAERVVLAGANHAVQRLGGPFNEGLSDSIDSHDDRATEIGR